MPSYNIAPSQQVVSIINDGNKNRLGNSKLNVKGYFLTKLYYKVTNSSVTWENELKLLNEEM